MTAEQFAYWLQGFAELHPEPPTAAQWQSIREHVGSVFGKETPPLGGERTYPQTLPLEKIRRVLRHQPPAARDRLIC